MSVAGPQVHEIANSLDRGRLMSASVDISPHAEMSTVSNQAKSAGFEVCGQSGNNEVAIEGRRSSRRTSLFARFRRLTMVYFAISEWHSSISVEGVKERALPM